VSGIGHHVCEGCGKEHPTLGHYLDCLESHEPRGERPMTSEEDRCGTPAPLYKGDEVPNFCDLRKGHTGKHSAPDHTDDFPRTFRSLRYYRREWTDDQ
jgi:hypothetical protein